METYFTWYNAKIAWVYVQKYWSYAAMIVLFISLILLAKYQDLQFTKQFKQISDGYDDEIKKINAARVKERKQLEQNQRVLEVKLTTIEKQYQSRMNELDEKKRVEVESLIKKFKNDPDKLATEISKRTGFRIVYPIPDINPYE